MPKGHPTDGAGRQHDPPATAHQVLGDLAAGLGAADHQHRPFRELVGTAVVGGVVLGNPVGESAGERRDLRQVLVAGGDHDGAGQNGTPAGRQGISVTGG